jgi:16S rRNA (cytosine967-C5)-methyltransferase
VTASVEMAKASVRRLACEILLKVDTKKSYADILLDHALKAESLTERDRSLLTELVYGTLRWRGKIDAQLSHHLRRPLAQTDGGLRNLLRLTCYQLVFLDRIPDYAAVNEAVALAKTRGGAKAAGFVNGVLRSFLRQANRNIAPNSEDLSLEARAIEYSHPQWLVQRWSEEFGVESAQKLMRANNERSPLVLRVNSLQCVREKLLQRFAAAGIDATAGNRSPQAIAVQSAGAVGNLPGYSAGLFQVQGEASQLVAFLLSPLPGERILDACAAPGGKSTHVAELMNDQGELVAIDKSAPGIERIRQNVNRLRLKSLRLVCADASEKLPSLTAGSFDRILVDAPCSGLGTLRSHPEIKWQRNESDIQRLRRLQAKILQRVATYLKPGGVLVYATCTLSRAENERNIELFLAEHPEFELQEAARYLPIQARQMVRDKFFQALPQRDHTDGFFAARMRKAS